MRFRQILKKVFFSLIPLYKAILVLFLPIPKRLPLATGAVSIDPKKEMIFVVISCLNQLAYTQQVLDSYFRACDGDYNYILLIADDCSQDRTEEVIKGVLNKSKNMCYLRYAFNVGLTQTWNDGINLGLKRFKANYIFLVNNDVIIPKKAFSRLASHLKDNPKIGVIGPYTNAPGPQKMQDIRRSLPQYLPSDDPIDIEKVNDAIKNLPPVELDYVNGFFMGFRSEVLAQTVFMQLQQTFYFNPLNRNTGNEDDVQMRLRARKFMSFLAQNVFVFHYKDVSQERYPKDSDEVFRKHC